MLGSGSGVGSVTEARNGAGESRNAAKAAVCAWTDNVILGGWRSGHVDFSLRSAEVRRRGSLRLFLQTVYDAYDSLFNMSNIKIDKQTKLVTREFQVSQQLFVMHIQQRFYRLDFHNYAILNEQIQPKSNI